MDQKIVPSIQWDDYKMQYTMVVMQSVLGTLSVVLVFVLMTNALRLARKNRRNAVRPLLLTGVAICLLGVALGLFFEALALSLSAKEVVAPIVAVIIAIGAIVFVGCLADEKIDRKVMTAPQRVWEEVKGHFTALA